MNFAVRIANLAIWFVSSYFLLKYAGKLHSAINRRFLGIFTKK